MKSLIGVPFSYILRNIAARKLTTALTTLGMALVVFVFATVLMLSEGLRKTLVETGAYDNAVVIRRSSQTEIQSSVDRYQAAVIEARPEIAFGSSGEKLISKETVVLIVLNKRESDKPSNVVIRGIGKMGMALRPQIKITEGRMFKPGTSEIIAGHSIAQGFKGGGIGETLRFGQRDWTVVGIFDAANSGFDSEVWGDADQLMQAFRRQIFSSVIFKLADSSEFDSLKKQLESGQRLTIEVKRETIFYADQSEVMAKFISILGMTLSIIFSVGAIIGAMITMYASVASRVPEIGTLRALGFKRKNILAVFLFESLMLGFIGGLVGLFFASFMRFLRISTMNWQTFSELAFGFELNAAIIFQSLIFALVMGLIGGFLPAARAARMNIVDALRAA
jgi:ABC-type antimicrobial peptide transport system permease subunit